MRLDRSLVAGLAGALLAFAVPAMAQSWDTYSYPAAGFAVQFPTPPAVERGAWRTNAGLSVPSAIYAARLDRVDYVVTIADFSGTALDKDAAIADASKVLVKDGQVMVDVEARISTEYGRELSIAHKDGAMAIVAAFFIKQKLYVLEGRAPGPDAKASSASLIHFQQSLQFIE